MADIPPPPPLDVLSVGRKVIVDGRKTGVRVTGCSTCMARRVMRIQALEGVCTGRAVLRPGPLRCRTVGRCGVRRAYGDKRWCGGRSALFHGQ
jgi:hypothetical protein